MGYRRRAHTLSHKTLIFSSQIHRFTLFLGLCDGWSLFPEMISCCSFSGLGCFTHTYTLTLSTQLNTWESLCRSRSSLLVQQSSVWYSASQTLKASTSPDPQLFYQLRETLVRPPFYAVGSGNSRLGQSFSSPHLSTVP